MNDAAKVDRITTAIARGNVASFRKLVTAENANWRDEDGVSLVNNVILDEDAPVDMLRHLIACGADIKSGDGRRYTPLHFAARDQRLGMVEVLLEAGAEIDAQDSDGKTPLTHCALRLEPDLELVALLLKHGADPKKKSKGDGSPMQIARLGEDKELMALFKAAAPRPKRKSPTPRAKAARTVAGRRTKKAARPTTKKRQ